MRCILNKINYGFFGIFWVVIDLRFYLIFGLVYIFFVIGFLLVRWCYFVYGKCCRGGRGIFNWSRIFIRIMGVMFFEFCVRILVCFICVNFIILYFFVFYRFYFWNMIKKVFYFIGLLWGRIYGCEGVCVMNVLFSVLVRFIWIVFKG